MNRISQAYQALIEVQLNAIRAQYPKLDAIVQALHKQGATAYLVGGSVRDIILQLPIKDLDIEVHGIELEPLREILSQFSPVDLVGKSFGVLRTFDMPIDWSLPRSDAAGRKPVVHIDTSLSIEEALKRRDLTMNAMAINLHTKEFIDPFNGLDDIEKKVLRSPDPYFFVQDPLRFFRVVQFISRFEMMPDAELTNVCTTMDLTSISRERVEQEFEKLLLLSKRPSLGLRWYHRIDRLKELLPELAVLSKVPQDPEWHPEGDVFEHTMQAIDVAATNADLDRSTRLQLMYGVMCHDLGKAVTTRMINGRLRSYEHEMKGVPIAQSLLKHITENQELIDVVSLLVRHHMAPGMFIKHDATPRAYKKLALQLGSHANLHLLSLLADADRRGRQKDGRMLMQRDETVMVFAERAKEYGVINKPEEALVKGRDLLSMVAPGPILGQLLKNAYDIQIEENIHNKDELIKRVMSGYKTLQQKYVSEKKEIKKLN
jgi:tRNA nucleotidyltransferase (CCA-adding enzyme)